MLVIGGGPAGSTIAALLAEHGRDVVLLEKAHHPRFHIGESLLPANVPLFERLGVREQVERIGMPKYGVEFVSPDHDHRAYFEFAEAWDKSHALRLAGAALGVRRDPVPQRRRARARRRSKAAGCARSRFDADGATRAGRARRRRAGARWRARFVVDASGRDTLLANQFGCKREEPEAQQRGAVRPLHRRASGCPARPKATSRIFWFEHGWFWFIPLADGTTSVGAVCWPYYLKSRDKPLTEFFRDTIALCPALAERLKGATLVDDAVHATGNYSYSSTHCSGERFLMLGDAYAFIDPVFSSGVFLAMNSAFDGADVVEATLDRPRRGGARARRRFDAAHAARARASSRGSSTASPNPTMRELFMHPRNPLRVKEALLSLLAGDIYGKTPIWPSILALKALYYLVSLGNLGRSLCGSGSAGASTSATSRLRRREPRRGPGGPVPRRPLRCLPRAGGRAGAHAPTTCPLPGPEVEGPVESGAAPSAAPAPASRSGSSASASPRCRFRRLSRLRPDEHLCAAACPSVAYRGPFLRADRDGARAILFAGQRIVVDLSLGASVPTRSNDNEARQGMPDLAGTFEIGPNVNVGLWQSDDRQHEARACVCRCARRSPCRRRRRRSASVFSPNLNLDVRGLAGRWNLGMLAGPLFADRRYHEYFYGVAPSLRDGDAAGLRGAGRLCRLARHGGVRRAASATSGSAASFATTTCTAPSFAASPLVRREQRADRGLRRVLDLRRLRPARGGRRLTATRRSPEPPGPAHRLLFALLIVAARH